MRWPSSKNPGPDSQSGVNYPIDPQDKLPHAYGGPSCLGVLRKVPDDFRVTEIPLVEPDGHGEHCLLEIEKCNQNTESVAKLLARHACVRNADVSYAGMKDRNAVTRQWFSVRLAGRSEPAWDDLNSADLRILQAARHSRKLRVGALRGNRFCLRIREFRDGQGRLEQIMQSLQAGGMPNYFGAQRFGREGSNLTGAGALFGGVRGRLDRKRRGLYLSAARSMLFNRVLGIRVSDGTWNQAFPGERLILDGSRNSFVPEMIDPVIMERLADMDIHPSGPLWGTGYQSTNTESAALEQRALHGMEGWQKGLERSGLKYERRALRAPIRNLTWGLEGDDLLLEFSLGKGSYATVLIREIITTS